MLAVIIRIVVFLLLGIRFSFAWSFYYYYTQFSGGELNDEEKELFCYIHIIITLLV